MSHRDETESNDEIEDDIDRPRSVQTLDSIIQQFIEKNFPVDIDEDDD